VKPQHACFLVLWLVSILIFAGPVGALLALSLHDDRYTYIALIPLIVGGLLWLERRRILAHSESSPLAGAPLILIGILILAATEARSLSLDSLWLVALGLVLIWNGAFISCYGLRSFRNACFPLLLLLWIVPFPAALLDRVVVMLQAGSTEVAYFLLRLVHVPVLRHGFSLSLPGLEIEVAPECSGIRSAISLLISGFVTGHLLLQSNWKKLSLMLCIAPVMILKNAVRIVTISLLGIYVDRGFLFGSLHRYGGLPFSLVALTILIPLVWMLWKSEHSGVSSRQVPASSGVDLQSWTGR